MADEAVAVASGTPEPGAVSVPAPEAAAPAAAPAAFSAPAETSSAPEAPPAPEAPVAEASPSSPLGGAKAEEAAAAAPEAKPDDGAPAAEAPAPVEAKDLPLPTYEPFTLPEGVQLDDGSVGNFTTLLGEFERTVAADPSQAHAAAQSLGQKLVDLYLAEATSAQQRMTQLQTESWERAKEGWLGQFRDDPDIGKNRMTTTLSRAGAVLEQYGRALGSEREAAVRQAFDLTGAGYHPEVIRLMNWMANRFVETARPVPAVVPRSPASIGSRANRLYRNTPGAA